MRPVLGTLAVSLAWIAVAGCDRARPRAGVAATTSYLEYAAKDLLGAEVPVLRLAGPGMCPGHFDMRLSQARRVRECRLLLRFDFQQSLDAKLAEATDAGLKIVSVRVPGGMCEPASYQAVCRQVADALIAANLIDSAAAEARLAQVGRRLAEQGRRAKQQIDRAGLAGTSVIASGHQEAFCRWLGLKVVATFTAADQAGIRQLDEALRAAEKARARLVVANRPEGRQAADALAERLGARVVVLGNFPDPGAGHARIDDLIVANVSALLAAAKP